MLAKKDPTLERTTGKASVVEQEATRVEANIEELPVFSATKRARREDIVEWRRRGRDPKTHQPINQELIIRPARGLGLPGQVERDLYYLVLCPWIEANGFGPRGQIGPISYQEAITRLGWQRSGQNYNKIREALRILVSLNFEFRNCILDGATRQIEAYVYGHLFDKVSGIEEKSVSSAQIMRGQFVILAADWFVKNHQAGYVKPLDLRVYRALKGPVAQSLYNYLDKRAYSARRRTYEKQVEEDIFVLKERFRLGVKHTKHLLEEFRRAHDELMKGWPILHDATIEKVGKGRYRCVYTFDTQIDIPFDVETAAAQPEKPVETKVPPLAAELRKRGITESVALRLIRDYPEDQIRRHIDIHDQELKQQGSNIKNPPGRLRKRIQESWNAPDSYQTPQDHQKRAQEAKLRATAEAEERDRQTNWWKYHTPAERARQHVEGFWMFQWQGNNGWGREPSEEERHEAYLEALKRFTNEAEEGKAQLAEK